MQKRYLQLERDLKNLADAGQKNILQTFFKTGPGQYAAEDIFLGVTVPQQRKLIKNYLDLTIAEMKSLLRSPYHECRMSALLILVAQFKREDLPYRLKAYTLYLRSTRHINNWDLVDATAPHIVGAYLRTSDKSPMPVLGKLAASSWLWDRRIAVVSTLNYIKSGDPRPTLALARKLMNDDHDLMQKAIGWMLREVGKHCSLNALETYLEAYGAVMPRTTLRYAIERLPETRKRYFMSLRKKSDKIGRNR
ncbi:MAG: DNA alkylation repair protein [Deltaproteobacteria bacterium]|nr:DNA alkylation repair protein [Deltaproteobacteria bacterium]